MFIISRPFHENNPYWVKIWMRILYKTYQKWPTHITNFYHSKDFFIYKHTSHIRYFYNFDSYYKSNKNTSKHLMKNNDLKKVFQIWNNVSDHQYVLSSKYQFVYFYYQFKIIKFVLCHRYWFTKKACFLKLGFQTFVLPDLLGLGTWGNW